MSDFYNFSTVMEEDTPKKFFESDSPFMNVEEPSNEVSLCAKNIFGINSLFPWQRLAIANILDGVQEIKTLETETKNAKPSNISDISDATVKFTSSDFNEYKSDFVFEEDSNLRAKQIILLPTGAGKSLCFQVPALLLPRPTLIVYPLLALMSDQVRRLKEVGLEPVLLRGEQSEEERNEALYRLEHFQETGVKLIIANPEILQSEKILQLLKKMKISHFAIDEAHCVSEWGDSFRPSYLKLKNIIERIKPKAVTAFTATASPSVLSRISEILFDGQAHIVRGETDRKNLHYFVKPCRVKKPALLELIQTCEKPMVIFASSREGTERIAAFLRYTFQNDEIKFYHAGLERAEKDACETWFNAAEQGILVATCAWGMGVDKKNIRTVIHYDAPTTLEAYVQEAGRGGRDGLISKAFLLWSKDDLTRLEKVPSSSLARAKQVIEYATTKSCRRKVLLKGLGDLNASSKYTEMQEIYCSGCDICNKTAIHEPQDEIKLLRFLKKHKNAFTSRDLVNHLIAVNKNWQANDVKDLIWLLKKENKIIENKNFFWKKRLKLN